MPEQTDVTEEEPQVHPVQIERWKWLRAVGIYLGQESRELGQESWRALKIILVLLVFCGVMYPALLFIIGQIAFHDQANGSLITDVQGHVRGSGLLGQQFIRPEYFHGRPSVVGYDASSSGGSNLGPGNPQLITGTGSQITIGRGTPVPANGTPVPGQKNTYVVPGSYLGVKAYAQQFRQENGLSSNAPLPADVLTASGSGLDPAISVEAALLQMNRIVTARRTDGGSNATITLEKVRELITQNTQGRDLWVIGEPGVNVLTLNLALDSMYGVPPTK